MLSCPSIFHVVNLGKQIARNRLGLNESAHELAKEEAAKEKAKKEKEAREAEKSKKKQKS